MPDLVRIVVAVFAGSLLLAAILVCFFILQPDLMGRVPLPFWPVEFLLTLTVVGGARFGIRAASTSPSIDPALRQIARRPCSTGPVASA